MDVDKDFVDMFLAGMSWERRKGTKPALRDAILEAFSLTRAAEQKRAPVQTEQGWVRCPNCKHFHPEIVLHCDICGAFIPTPTRSVGG